jgi:hypothetical protein
LNLFAASDSDSLYPGSTAAPVVLRRIPDRRDRASRERLLQRLATEFMEMPGLRLNGVQTARLLGSTPEICTRALATLAERRVLTISEDGSYSLDFQRI